MPVRSLTDEQRELVEKNIGLAGAVARAFGKESHLDFQERRGAALLGLCHAARSFDPEKARFSTYGTIGARTAIRQAIRDSYVISIGVDQHRHLIAGEEPSGPTSTRIRKQAEHATRVRSLPFDGGFVPERRGASELKIAEQKEFCSAILRHLDWRRRLAVRQCVMRGRKLRELASMLGVTTERARQLREEGLSRLRAIIEERDG